MNKYEDTLLTMKLVKRDYKNDGFEQDYLDKVIDLLKQAEKQEKLLNKIKEIVKEESIKLDNMNEWGIGSVFNSRVLERLEKVLKELENE